MFEDADLALDAIGAILIVGLIGGLVLVGVIATNPPELATGAPEADWTLDRINDTHVRIGHDGGEPVPASELLVTVAGNRREVPTRGNLRAGDTFIVRAERGEYVELYWTGGEGGPQSLATWQAA